MNKSWFVIALILVVLSTSAGIVQAAPEPMTEAVVINIDGTMPFFNLPAKGTLQVVRMGDSSKTVDQWQMNLMMGSASCQGSGQGGEVWDGSGGTLTLASQDTWNCPVKFPMPLALQFDIKGSTFTMLGVPFNVSPAPQPPFAGPQEYTAVNTPEGLPADYDVFTGHYFTQTGKDGRGFGVRDAGADSLGNTIRFWTYYQAYGGIDTLGYPISRVFQLPDGFTYQAFQRGILQWRSIENAAWPVNTLDWLHDRGLDAMLDTTYGVAAYKSDDSGGDLIKAVQIRLDWLTNPEIKAAFLTNRNPAAFPTWTVTDSIRLYGLPTSMPEQRGPFIVQRFQRGALQLWTESIAGMPAKGSVVGVLAGDLVKAAGLLPAGALEPEQQ